MADVIVMNPIPQALCVLFLARGGRFEIFEHLFGEFICRGDRRTLLAEFIEFVAHPLQHVGLMFDDLRSDHASASADDGEAFVLALEDAKRFDPRGQVGVRQEGGLSLQDRVADEDDLLRWKDRPDRAARGTRMTFEQDRRFSPAQ